MHLWRVQIQNGWLIGQGVWQQLQAAQAAQLDRQRAGRVYDVALGAADISADISTESDAFPQPPREFRPPPGLGEVAVRAAHARLRALQSRWDVQSQRQWFKVRTPASQPLFSIFLVSNTLDFACAAMPMGHAAAALVSHNFNNWFATL